MTQLLHRQPHGGFRSGQRDDDAAGDEAGAGAAHHRGRADLLVAQHAEQLAEAVEPLLEQRVDRFVRAVARRDAGAAGRDDHLRRRGWRELPLDASAHQLGSSLTIVRPTTVWPAAVSRSAMARPLVSVASVRVSLTVTTKQRTDGGALALCSTSLMGEIVREDWLSLEP